jgi:two-component system sensor histidine kinase KdpD
MSLSSDIPPEPARPEPVEGVQRLHPAAAYGLSVLMVGIATLAAVLVDQVQRVPNLSLIFVLPVVIAAVSFGWGPSLAAAVLGVLAFNFFLVAPRYSLGVADPANVWALGLLLITAAIVSAVAAESRRRALEARTAAEQATALQALARSLVAAAGDAGSAQASAAALARLFQAPAVVLLHGENELAVAALAGGGPGEGPGGGALSAADREAAGWALAARMPTRGGAYPVEAAAYDFWPVVTPQRRQAVIGVSISTGEAGRPENPERLVEIVSGYLAVALDREAYAAQVLESRVEVASERLKADLLAAVSHDLKTPLSTVLFTLQSLQTFAKTHDAKTRAELLNLAETETARLSAMVGNLLDMNRLDAGAVVVKTAAVEPAELAAEALRSAAVALAGREVFNEVSAEAAPLEVDASLFETALANVLENAAKYAPAGAPIRLRSGEGDGAGWIEVEDEGPGFEGAIEPMFEKFSRGVVGDGRPPGTGLGLSIARGFLEAQGGRVEAENLAGGKGARVRLSAPLAKALPA